MTAINFGVGTIIGRRTDISNPTPAFMGIAQEIEIDFDQTLKELVGQYKMPVDVAPAQLKVTGKAKFARIQANVLNDLFVGQSITLSSGSLMATAEAGTVPAMASFTITVANSANFRKDLGVFYAATGVQLTRVAAASEALGRYSVNESTGVYTFAAADANAAVQFYYQYAVTTLKQMSLANTFMGTGPSFELYIQQSYTNNLGVINQMFIKLHACRSSKLSWPFKNVDYTIQSFDFQAFADQANNWGTIATTE